MITACASPGPGSRGRGPQRLHSIRWLPEIWSLGNFSEQHTAELQGDRLAPGCITMWQSSACRAHSVPPRRLAFSGKYFVMGMQAKFTVEGEGCIAERWPGSPGPGGTRVFCGVDSRCRVTNTSSVIGVGTRATLLKVPLRGRADWPPSARHRPGPERTWKKRRAGGATGGKETHSPWRRQSRF